MKLCTLACFQRCGARDNFLCVRLESRPARERQNQHSELTARQVLLRAERLIRCNEQVELILSGIKQLTVRKP